MSSEWELKPHPVIPKGKPVLVCILDGFGENEIKDEYNAVHVGKTPTIDKLRGVEGRFRTVKAHGPAVGLPTWDDMGNSEVGHNALGAGQLIEQGARLVDKALSTGSLFTNPGFQYISSAFEKNTVHFIGLLSSGGVHSRQDQLEHRASAPPAPAAMDLVEGEPALLTVVLPHRGTDGACPSVSQSSAGRPSTERSAFVCTSSSTGVMSRTAALWLTLSAWRRCSRDSLSMSRSPSWAHAIYTRLFPPRDLP